MVQLTMLNSMAGKDFIQSLDTQREWGIKVLDLKNEIFGKSLIELTEEEAVRAANAIRERELSVYCLSTELFYDDIEKGEAHFCSGLLEKVNKVIQIAKIMQPKVVRLLAARSSKRRAFSYAPTYLQEVHPWIIPMYKKAIDVIFDSGFQVTIENECHDCILSNPDEVLGFFKLLDRNEKVYFTYDVQNLWEMGTFPTLDVYRQLAPLIGFYHVKGGRKGSFDLLEWKSSLEDASWPVIAITDQVIQDGCSPVICLNPSHGKVKEGYDYENIVKRDLDFLRKSFKEIE